MVVLVGLCNEDFFKKALVHLACRRYSSLYAAMEKWKEATTAVLPSLPLVTVRTTINNIPIAQYHRIKDHTQIKDANITLD